MREFHGKTAIITGAASGIGRGLAVTAAERGMNLGLIDVDGPVLAELAAELTERHATTCATAIADVSEPSQVQAAADRLRDALGDVHLVCNNAGVGLRSSILETPFENFNWLCSVNIGGVFNVIKVFTPRLIGHGESAHMLITCSLAGLYEMPERENAVYSATKMAVFALARNLAVELRASGVGVSALCPGLVLSNARRSGEHRPERFGGPFSRPDQGRVQAGMTPEETGRIAFRGIADGRFLIVTHPTARPELIARQEAILNEFDRWEPVIRELGISTSLPAVP